MSCPLCHKRKAKRRCPALSLVICSVCCGTKRQVEIRCPGDCPHLAACRHHPPAVAQRQHERDIKALAPFLTDVTERQYALLLWLHAGTAPHRASAIPAVQDADLAEAAECLASTLETAAKGIIYEHPAATIPGQRLVEEFRRAIAHVEGDRPGRLSSDAAAALRLMARLVRGISKSDPSPTALLGVLDRLVARHSSADAPAYAGQTTPSDDGPKIVLA